MGPNSEDIMSKDLVGILMCFFLVSLSMQLALKWPGAAAAKTTLTHSASKEQSLDFNVVSGPLFLGALPPKYFLSYPKETAANYVPNLENRKDEVQSNDDDRNHDGNFKAGEQDDGQRRANNRTEMFETREVRPVEMLERQIFSGKLNSIDRLGGVIPHTPLEDNASYESHLKQEQPKKSTQLLTDFTKERKRREKKNEVKHVLKVTYDFIHPRIMTPIAAFARTHKRDSDFHSQSESLKIKQQIFERKTPSMKFHYNDVEFHETDHVPFHKRTEDTISEGAKGPVLENNLVSEPKDKGTTVAQRSGVPGMLSSADNVAAPPTASKILNKILTPMAMMEGEPAILNETKGTPRSSDPETDALHMTTVTFDPSAMVTIPPGQFDTMDLDVPGEPLTPEDYQKAALTDDEPIDTSRQVDPTTTAEQFEGDIKLVEDDKPINKTALHGLPSFRSGIVSSERLWPNGNVPYVLSSTFRPEERSIIAKAIKTLHDLSCVHLVPHTNERDYIHILKGDGCTSNIGRVGGSQALSLGPGCIKAGVVMHELMHALGFWHEQSRFDRDRYININWDNIQKGKGYNFQKYDFKGLQHVGTQYDFESLMHYSPYAFAKNRSVPTVEPKEGQHEVGQRRGLSSNDLHRLMELYPCPNATSPANFPNVHLPTATLPPPVPGLCLDIDKHCAKWAQERQCTENPAWMMLHCRQSCNQCAESKCVDLNEKCSVWKADGQCELNAPYMHLYCSKSCQLCAGTETTSGKCFNSNKKCGLWASQGNCIRYPGYMNRFCRQSCRQC
ncbi:Peptidase M12A [Trinorchestia longiramus]|nr:Peptidase M12A [Trinorchestia longiramus]